MQRAAFYCFEGSEQFVTYRSELHATASLPVTSLLSVMEEWVEGGARLTVRGVALAVDDSCPIALSGFDDEGCPREEEGDGAVNTAAIALPLSGVFGLAIILILALIVMRKLQKSRYNNFNSCRNIIM